MVDAVVTVCLEKVLNILEEQGRVVSEYSKQLKGLQNELQYMQIFLKDADRRKRTDELMRKLVTDLRELVYEAEDLLMDCQLEDGDEDSNNEERRSSNAWLSWFNPARVPLQYMKSKRLKEINEEISAIKTRVESYFKLRAPSNVGIDNGTDRWSSTVYDHSQVVGLEEDKRKIKEWLFKSNESELLMMAFVGMGGLGKTTIAQVVFNDKEIENCFEKRIWVTVSHTFTEEQIMRSILRNLGDTSVGDDLGTLLKKIQQYLMGKRYLIVMDDVWDKNLSWWDKICQGLPRGQGGSVIVTTRSESVAVKVQARDKTHRPELLSADNSWLLFCKVAFAANSGVCERPELEDVGKEIVTKCKGLPLMIKTVGGLLLCKEHVYHEWRRIEESLKDELRENSSLTADVMSSLQLSYDELPSHLKSCFLTLSLYPEDCVVPKQQLVHGWIGEGFVMQRNGRSSTVSGGEDCFSGLTNRCLVEVVDKTYSGTILTCKIHDMVRDLVIEIAKNDSFSNPKSLNSRHLGISENKKIRVNPKLRGLVSTTKTGEVNELKSDQAKKFTDCKYLRVLDISRSIFDAPLSDILDDIASLKHLACLSMSNTHPLIKLPRSMEDLQNLQILDASYCHNLKQLQPCIVLFKKLLVLDMTNCGSLEYFPKGVGSLGNLEVLLGFKPSMSRKGCKLSEVKNLTNLRKLGLSLTCGDQIEEHELDSLVNLSKLMFISINCFDSYYGDDDLLNKIDALTPPHHLHELSLEFYPGNSSPSWLSPNKLPILRYMSICSGNLAKMHQNFWKNETNLHWRIEALMFHSLSALGIDWEELQRSMPYLRTVHANWCPELETFPIEDVAFTGGVWTKSPPPHRT